MDGGRCRSHIHTTCAQPHIHTHTQSEQKAYFFSRLLLSWQRVAVAVRVVRNGRVCCRCVRTRTGQDKTRQDSNQNQNEMEMRQFVRCKYFSKKIKDFSFSSFSSSSFLHFLLSSSISHALMFMVVVSYQDELIELVFAHFHPLHYCCCHCRCSSNLYFLLLLMAFDRLYASSTAWKRQANLCCPLSIKRSIFKPIQCLPFSDVSCFSGSRSMAAGNTAGSERPFALNA